MQHKHRFAAADGFTLMELVTVMVAAAIVTLAATTLMLFGLRSNTRTVDAIKQQNTARMLMDTLESLSTRGGIGGVQSGDGSWEILDENAALDDQGNLVGNVLYAYDQMTNTIYRGPVPAQQNNGQQSLALMENVISSDVDLSDANVLTFTLETEAGTYTSSVYCRNVKPKFVQNGIVGDLDDGDSVVDIVGGSQNADDIVPARIEFLTVLINQYKMKNGSANPGLILRTIYDSTTGEYQALGESTGRYYSEWYIGSYAANPGWDAQTPWCACYLSWALNICNAHGQIDSTSLPKRADGTVRDKWYASVDDFVAYFEGGAPQDDGTGHYWLDNRLHSQVRPGDLIVFDWNLDKDPSHIGAVLMIKGDRVFTIEGNTSNRVGVRSYKLTDPRIMGYGVIDWTTPAA